MKRILSLLLCAIITFILPLSAFEIKVSANEEYVKGYYTYEVVDNEAIITGVNTEISGEVIVPSEICGYSVTAIDDFAFQGCSKITSVTVPNSVKSIGECSFRYCISLSSISLPFTGKTPTSNEYFGHIFSGTNSNIGVPISLKTVVITGGTSIGDFVFSKCSNVDKIVIPNTVTTIGVSAFEDCKDLVSITIPDSVECIQYDAFKGCNKLNKVNINDIAAWCNIDFDGTFSNPLYYAKNLYLKEKLLTSLEIPNSVTSIGEKAFYNCNSIKSLTVSDGVKNIEKEAFAYCASLKNVTIGKTVESIGSNAFIKCDNIEQISVPFVGGERGECEKSHLGYFFGASSYNYNDANIPFSLKTVVITNADKIEDNAFFNCSFVEKIIVSSSLVSIGKDAFHYCSLLKSVTLPKSIKNIAEGAFKGCSNLKDIWYIGSEKDRKGIVIANEDSALTSATWHYNSCPLGENHIYSNDCDKTCNFCTATRNVGSHKYDNVCDAYCNNCNLRRSVPSHKYTNSCDAYCNNCNNKRSITHKYDKVTVKKATTSKNGYKLTECSVCYKDKSKTVYYAAKTVKLSSTVFTYNGKTKKPSVILKDSNGKTISSKYYTVYYSSGRKYVGKYKVTVKFKGRYSGSKTLYFTIKPRAASINKLTAKTKAISVKLNRSLKQSTGYQIQYSTSKSFKSYKTIRLTNYKKSVVTIKNLKSKKYYYVRVRTYKSVKGTRYYSNWSSYKKVKTK